MTEPSITCPVCGMTSHHPRDIIEGYCAACHDWTGAMGELRDRLPFEDVARGLHRDRQGHPITFARWVWLYEGAWLPGHPAYGYKRVAQDDLPGDIRVSTIWEGMAVSPPEYGPPEIFETAIFVDGEMKHRERYTTEAEALATHRTLVKSLELVGRSFLDEVAAES